MFYKKIWYKYFLLVTGLLIIVTSAGWRQKNLERFLYLNGNASSSEGEKTTDEVFKNIKVLNGQPASQLGPTMHFFEAALGFNCANCHVKDASGMQFEKDDKPEKRKARDMITMMNAINKENFKGEQLVTCFTCHRGNPNPETIPAVITVSMLKDIESTENEEETIKVPNRLDNAEDVIHKYQEAIGGKDAFEKISSLELNGVVEDGMGKETSTTVYEKAPDLYYSETQSPQGMVQKGYNGEVGWFKTSRFERKIAGDDLQDLKLNADFYAPLDFEKNYSGLKLDEVEMINKDTVYSIEGNFSKYRRFKFFFDVNSGFLVRQIQFDQTLAGDLQIQTDYKDYRNVNGVLYPFEIDVADNANIQQFKFKTIKPNVTIDEKIFDLPVK
jgi:hypothetical protein